MTTTTFTIEWNLRQRMAEQDIFKTSALVPLLAEHGVKLSREQVYRLVTQVPARLNVEVLGALCLILGCTPDDLITVTPLAGQVKDTGTEAPRAGKLGDLRPVPARISRPR